MGLRFAKTSLFPNISYDDILEIEFMMTYRLGIPFEYNNKEFYELIWLYERLGRQIEKENQQKQEQDGMNVFNSLRGG